MKQNKTNKKKKSISKRRIIAANLFLFFTIALLLLWSVREYFHLNEKGYTNDAQVEEFINPINSKVQGYIKDIRFNEHQKVRKGDTLVVIDDREYQIHLAQAEAAYLNAVAAQEVAQSGIVTLKNSIDVSKANIEANQSTLSNVEKNYIRYQNLYRENVVTKAQLEDIESKYQSLKLKIKAMQEQEESTRLAIKEAQTRLKINQAQVKSALAALDMARLNVGYCTVVAPYDCTAGRKKLQNGQLIQPGQQLLSIVKDNEIWVVANFKERQMQYIEIGQKVKLTVDALDDKEFEGTITAISGASGSRYSAIPVDNSTGNFVKVQQRFPARIELSGLNSAPDCELLRAGMNVIVSVIH
ncbi:MAG: HlyD family secretion protein [Marinifilaceae bacterium]